MKMPIFVLGLPKLWGGIDRGSERSVPVLIQLMEDESDLVREAVIKSLSLMPSPARTSLLGSSLPSIGAGASGGLSGFGKDGA